MTNKGYPDLNKRGKFMRYDTALILKRFHWIERTMVTGQAGWISNMPYFEAKTKLPKMIWEDAMTADALRERVFELRFPNRMLEIADDVALIKVIKFAHRAPNALAFLKGMAEVLKPAVQHAYEQYLELADEIGDGPTYRFMNMAIREKKLQIAYWEKLFPTIELKTEQKDIQAAEKWTKQLQQLVDEVGGIGLEQPKIEIQLPPIDDFHPSQVPQRGKSFRNVRYYWPDNVDPTFPYGEGIQLQLRSAISHFNEVWAVEQAGFCLHEFADELGWDFINDAARWTYDESRHSLMGYERLKRWGFQDEELPLGTYIFDSCQGQDPIIRLGMLFYFESKNIGKKIDRIKSFGEMSDRVSQHDMDFDWADETIHTSYGKTWLSKILEKRNENPNDYSVIKERCEKIVREEIGNAQEEDITEIKQIANDMIEKAKQLQQ